MNDIVAIRAKRILTPMKYYHTIAQGNSNLTNIKVLRIDKDEIFLGIYRDTLSEEDVYTIITDKGLHICKGSSSLSIKYSDIASVDSPIDKHTKGGLTLNLYSNQEIYLPITGTHGKFHDRYEFLRFLTRVIEDIKSS